jgi:preprotein translocase subunit SecY
MISWKSIFSYPDLRQKIFYTLGILIVVRLGTHVAIPGIDTARLASLFSGNDLLGLVNLFSGGALSNFSLFSMGIIPYINASIIMQLLTILMPQLKEMAEEGEVGRKKLAQYIRYLTIGLGTLQALAVSLGFRDFLLPGVNSEFFIISSVVSLVAGTALVMWLGELISEKGIGNGASIIIFVGIISRLPADLIQTFTLIRGGVPVFAVLILIVSILLVIMSIVFIQEGQRRVPVQYAKRIVGNKMYGGQNTFIPLKINQGGVIPIIFASSLLMFPATITRFIPFLHGLSNALTPGHLLYMVLFFILIFFFTYFYTAITFNPVELANNIQKYGGFILGVRPGKPTAEYLEKIITRLTFLGAIFLSLVAISPMITANFTRVTSFAGLGGTALLIVVGVALDLVRQINTQLLNRSYEGIAQ